MTRMKLSVLAAPFQGRWRITEMDLWDKVALDLVEPAFLEISGQEGEMGFIAVTAWLDIATARALERRLPSCPGRASTRAINDQAAGGSRLEPPAVSSASSISIWGTTRASCANRGEFFNSLLDPALPQNSTNGAIVEVNPDASPSKVLPLPVAGGLMGTSPDDPERDFQLSASKTEMPPSPSLVLDGQSHPLPFRACPRAKPPRPSSRVAVAVTWAVRFVEDGTFKICNLAERETAELFVRGAVARGVDIRSWAEVRTTDQPLPEFVIDASKQA